MSNKYIFIIGILVVASVLIFYTTHHQEISEPSSNTMTTIDLQSITTTNKDNNVSVLLDKSEYTKGIPITITVKNNTARIQDIVSPLYVVERYDGAKWVQVKKLECPCGYDCKIAPYFRLEAGLSQAYIWNQKEEWCKDERSTSLVSNQASPGAYRVKVLIAEKDQAHGEKDVVYYSQAFLVRE